MSTAADSEQSTRLRLAVLYQFGFGLTRSAADAIDLVQKTLLVPAEKEAPARDETALKHWLLGALHRQFLESRRHQSRFPHFELAEGDASLLAASAPTAAGQPGTARVLRVLATLDDIYQAPLLLFYLLDADSSQEIATILDAAPGTVQARIARGRAQVHERLTVGNSIDTSEPREADGVTGVENWLRRGGLNTPDFPAFPDPRPSAARASAGDDPDDGVSLAADLPPARQPALDDAIRASLRGIAPPLDLAERIFTRARPVPAPPAAVRWRFQPLQLAAVMAMLLLAVAAVFGISRRWQAPADFAVFCDDMLALLEERVPMQLHSSDLGEIRGFLAQTGAPDDFPLPPTLDRVNADGCTSLRWRSAPVAVVCFDITERKQQELYVFVVNRTEVSNAPEPDQGWHFGTAGRYLTARWTQGDKGFLLAGLVELGSLEKYLPASGAASGQ